MNREDQMKSSSARLLLGLRVLSKNLSFGCHIQELNTRFLKEDQVAYSLCSLMLENIVCFSDDELLKLASELLFWNDDLPCMSKSDLLRELTEWRRKCKIPAKKTPETPKIC